MPNNVKRRFTVSLDIDTKTAERQVKKAADDLKTILADMSTSSNKMGYFKELIDYLQQVDSELTRLKTKHGKTFEKMFGGLDVKLRDEIKNIFSMAGTDLSQFDILRKKIQEAADLDEYALNDVKQEIKEILNLVGIKDVNLDFTGSVKEQAEKLNGVLDDVVKHFGDVNTKIGKGFGFENIEKATISYDKLKAKVHEFNNVLKERNKYDESSDEYSNLDNKLEEISNYIEKISGLKFGDGLEELREVFIGWGFGDIESKEEALEQLCNILQIDIPKGANAASDAMDKVGKSTLSSVVDSKTAIAELSKQLQTIHDMGRKTENEFGFTVNADGANYIIESSKDIVKASEEAAVAVKSLNDNITIFGHTHPDGGGLFSANDYESAINQYRSGINSPAVVIGNKFASMLNLDGATDEVIQQVESVLRKYMESDRSVGPSTIKKIQEIFSANGLPNALKTFDISNGMDKLAEALYNVSLNATNAQTPLEKLQSLITYYSGNKLSANNIAAFNDEWKEFESGAKSAAEVFDSVMAKLGATDLEGNAFNTSSKQNQNLDAYLQMLDSGARSADNATAELAQTGETAQNAEAKMESFFALVEKIRSMSFENPISGMTDNVEIGKYTERIEVLKAELDELGATGKIVADDMQRITAAFDSAKHHLNIMETHYTGYGDGYDGYSTSEYNREKNRADEAESNALTYESEANRLLDEKFALQEEIESLRKQLKDQQKVNDDANYASINSAEINQLETLQQKLIEVRNAVDAKTCAFEEEYVTVDAAVEAEIASLNRLKALLEEIQNILRVVFSVDGSNFGNINIPSGDSGENLMSVATQSIQQTLVQILGALNNIDFATEGTLSTIKDNVIPIADMTKSKQDADAAQNENIKQTIGTLVSALTANINSLKSVMDGVVVHQKTQKSDTTKAMARIQDSKQSQIVSGIAKDSVKTLGTEVEIESLQALANGLVKVEGAFKNASGQWEGFTVKVNEHNKAVDLAVKKHSALANQLNAEQVDEQGLAIATKKLQTYKSDADKLFKDLGIGLNNIYKTPEQQRLTDIYEQIIEKIDLLKKSNTVLTDSQIYDVNRLVSAFQREADAYLKKENAKKDAEAQKNKKQEEFKVSYDKQLDDFDKYSKDIKDAGYMTDELKSKVEQLETSLLSIDNQASLDKWQAEFKTLQSEIDVSKNALNAFNERVIKENKGKANALIKGLGFDVNGSGLNEDQQKISNTYKEALKVLSDYKASIKDSKTIEISRIDNVIAKLKEQTRAYKEAYHISDVNTKNFGATVVRRESSRYEKFNDLASYENSGFSSSPEFMAKFAQYKTQYQDLLRLQKQFASQDVVTPEQVSTFDNLKNHCAELGIELEKIVKASNALEQTAYRTPKELLGDFTDDVDGRKKALTDYVKQMYNMGSETVRFNKNFTECTYTVRNGDGTFTKMTATIDKYKRQIVETANETGSFANELREKFRSIGTYLISIVGIEGIFQQIRNGVGYIKEIDTALTELKKVTDETDASYDRFLQDMSKTAGVIGSTVSELTTMAAEWARLGYSMEESAQLAESTAILLNVSEFEDATAASEALISTMQAFGYAANESQHVVDILNEVGELIARR